jgi:hypothetical protein
MSRPPSAPRSSVISPVRGGQISSGRATIQAATPSAAPSAEHVRDLQELRTPRGKAFYTLSTVEAERAKLVHGFTPSGEANGLGLGLYNKRVEGSVAVHRLRLSLRFAQSRRKR